MGQTCSFKNFFFRFSELRRHLLRWGSFWPPARYVGLIWAFCPLKPTYLGLFEGFLTIIRQLGDNAVKVGFLRTTSGFLSISIHWVKCWARGGAGRMVGGANLYFFLIFFFVFSEFWRHFWRCGYFRPPSFTYSYSGRDQLGGLITGLVTTPQFLVSHALFQVSRWIKSGVSE